MMWANSTFSQPCWLMLLTKWTLCTKKSSAQLYLWYRELSWAFSLQILWTQIKTSFCDQKTHPILLSSFKQFNDLSLMSDSAILQMAWFAVVCTCKKRKQYLNQTVHHSTARCRHAYQMLDSEYRGNYKDLNLPKYMGWYGAVYFVKTVQ